MRGRRRWGGAGEDGSGAGGGGGGGGALGLGVGGRWGGDRTNSYRLVPPK